MAITFTVPTLLSRVAAAMSARLSDPHFRVSSTTTENGMPSSVACAGNIIASASPSATTQSTDQAANGRASACR
jgi:hypothetical protein